MDTTVNFIRDFLIGQMGCTDAILQPENAPLESANLYPINYCDGSPVDEVCIASINELSEVSFKIFPNPTSSVLNIQSDKSGDYDITIIDLMGRVVYTQNSVNGTISVDLSGVKTGNYLVRLTQNNNSGIQKLILE
jgi:hypothetical protein